MQQKSSNLLFRLVQGATFLVFLGRAWQHIFGEGPYRDFFWDEALVGAFVKGVFGWDWQYYLSNIATDGFIQDFTKGLGYFFLLNAVAALLVKRLPKISAFILKPGGLLLIFLALVYFMDRFFIFAQFFEYSIQFLSPFFLLYLARNKVNPRLVFWMKIAIALTFTCHGLFAAGVFPRPAVFVTMTMKILHLGEAQSILFLKAAAALDFLLSILIFLPFRKVRNVALAYAVFWGFFTSIARVWAFYHPAFWQDSLLQWTPETIMRMPHFLIPLFVLLYYLTQKSLSKEPNAAQPLP